MEHKYIKGNYYRSIYTNDLGYVIGLLKLKETNIEEFNDYLNKVITFTGYFDSLNETDMYILYGEVVNHPRFGLQFSVSSYEKTKPTDKLGIISFLSSDLFPGIGESIAKKIVDSIGEDALDKILENNTILDKIPKLNDKKKDIIITNLKKYDESHKVIVYLNDMGFNMKDALNIYNTYKGYTMDRVNNDIYSLIGVIDISFVKIDEVAHKLGYKDDDPKRIKACIIYIMDMLTYSNGDTYLLIDDIYSVTLRYLRLEIDIDLYKNYLEQLSLVDKIVIDDNKYYLKNIWDDQTYIVKKLHDLSNIENTKYNRLNQYIEDLEISYGIKYNDIQKDAIKSAIKDNVLIITGGPGTGKTTIIKAIVSLYQLIHNYNDDELLARVSLLAPTGRASKRMSESCMLPASTIHRFLKWNKENNEFAINEFNKDTHELIIIDEVSMIDIPLFASLLRGTKKDIKLILVGDYNQLPSVGPGELLKDLIDSGMFNTVHLNLLYRQDENSYIPFLAKEIKDNSLSETFLDTKSDYTFLECNSSMISESLKNICTKILDKNIDSSNIQVMAPMYKGENGIDNLNKILQSIFNPPSGTKREIKYGDIIFREGDKILGLVNMPEDNVYNGDIGIIKYIMTNNTKSGKDEIYVDYDGNVIKYTPKDFSKIMHGYIISIHKSQGSEFDIVIIPIVHNYNKMLYLKLIYTGITRAKKKLILLGEASSFVYSVSNNMEQYRKTDLKNKIINMYNVDNSN